MVNMRSSPVKGCLEFCEAIQPLLTKLQSTVKIGFMDDVTLSGDLLTVENDITIITQSSQETGFRLNTSKCEIIMTDFTQIDSLATFRDFVRVDKEEMSLLGAPVFKGRAQDTAYQHKIDDLKSYRSTITPTGQ